MQSRFDERRGYVASAPELRSLKMMRIIMTGPIGPIMPRPIIPPCSISCLSEMIFVQWEMRLVR